MTTEIVVVGGGLAGCECAWQLAIRGLSVTLIEQRPHACTPAHQSADLAELVCSNSLRGAALNNAVGALKEELRRCKSLIMTVADRNRVPAGGALAVDRNRFAADVTRCIEQHPRIRVERRHTSLPSQRPCVIATGPLTSDALAADLAGVLGGQALSYYDAIAPIVSAESIDTSIVFRQSRFEHADMGSEDDAAAYLNCPMDEPQYRAFVQALRTAEKVPTRAFEDERFFEGCLPVEVMAERGDMTLAFGPMKPVGLVDPRTGRRPFAVVQLRAEDTAQSAYNLVGFQTRMTYGEQRRVLRMIPGLEQAEFLRFGCMHRNTFIDAPRVLDERLQVRGCDGLYMAGQLTGVEGYVESAGCGLACGIMLAATIQGRACEPPPHTTLLGGLLRHLQRTDQPFQPSNVTWAHVPALAYKRGRTKADRKALMAERALGDIEAWFASQAPCEAP